MSAVPTITDEDMLASIARTQHANKTQAGVAEQLPEQKKSTTDQGPKKGFTEFLVNNRTIVLLVAVLIIAIIILFVYFYWFRKDNKEQHTQGSEMDMPGGMPPMPPPGYFGPPPGFPPHNTMPPAPPMQTHGQRPNPPQRPQAPAAQPVETSSSSQPVEDVQPPRESPKKDATSPTPKPILKPSTVNEKSPITSVGDDASTDDFEPVGMSPVEKRVSFDMEYKETNGDGMSELKEYMNMAVEEEADDKKYSE